MFYIRNIYLITNKIDGKQYVGQTKFTIEQRFDEHCYRGSYLHNAIVYHGSSNFSIELIEVVTDEEADIKENYYIHEYKTLYPHGYNLITGGLSALRGHTEESKRHISDGVKNSKKHKAALWRHGVVTVEYNDVIVKFNNWESIIDFIIDNNISKSKIRANIQTAINQGLRRDGLCYGLRWTTEKSYDRIGRV